LSILAGAIGCGECAPKKKSNLLYIQLSLDSTITQGGVDLGEIHAFPNPWPESSRNVRKPAGHDFKPACENAIKKPVLD
jgi:hypothetical protein